MADIGTIVGGAFGVIRDRPLSVLIWAVTYFVGAFALAALFGLLVFGQLTFAPVNPEATPGASFVLGLLVFYLAYLMLYVVLMNATFRTVLRPEQGRFAAMRLGGDEWRMFGLVLLVLVCSAVLLFIVQLLLGLVLGVLVAATSSVPALSFIVAIVVMLAYLAGLVWIGVRLSLLYPLTFHRRAISLDGAWALTKGRFWTLFLSYLVIGLLVTVLFGALVWISFGDSLGAIFRASGDPVAQQLAVQAMTQTMAETSLGARVAMGLVWGVAMAICIALWPGVLASATRELLLDTGRFSDEDVERTGAIFE